MNPSFSTRSKTNEVQLVDMGCPQGMVPIQRNRVHEGQTHDFKYSFSESQGGSFHTYASNIPGEYVSFYVAFLSFMKPEKPCMICMFNNLPTSKGEGDDSSND